MACCTLWVIQGATGGVCAGQGAGPASPSAPQQADKKHYLEFELKLVGSATEEKSLGGKDKQTTAIAYDEVIRGWVEMKMSPGGPRVGWFPAGQTTEVSLIFDDVKREDREETGEANTRAHSWVLETWTASDHVQANVSSTTLSIDPVKKCYDVQILVVEPRSPLVQYDKSEGETGHPSMIRDELPPPVHEKVTPETLRRWRSGMSGSVEGKASDQPLANQQGEIAGSVVTPVPQPADWKGRWSIRQEFSWKFSDALPPLELVVTCPGYEEWRPSAAPGPKAGALLECFATVRDLAGHQPVTKVKQFVWELVGTSHEPGIAMNFPLGSEAADPDIKLEPVEGQKAEGSNGQRVVRDQPGQFTDRAHILPYDWGGWTTLRVTAVMEDGTTLAGKYHGNGPAELPVPKREPKGFVAEHWKHMCGVTHLADDDDSEIEPVGLPGANGDGFTLYEEYRGFYENGVHVEGDPRHKDLFLHNRIGEDAAQGIWLFSSLSGLSVHPRLLEDEFDTKERVMNANRSAGPRRVAQHGLWLRTEPASGRFDGAMAVPVAGTEKLRGRPRNTQVIAVIPRDVPDTLFSKPYHISAYDQSFAYDRGIAHELFHACGVSHHGSGDGHAVMHFVFPDDPVDGTGQARFTISINYNDKPATLIDEDTLKSSVERMAPQFEATRKALRQYLYDSMLADERQHPSINYTPEQWTEHVVCREAGFLWLFLGVKHGLCSGDEDCVMRYYFADAYEAEGRENTFYVIPPGASERAGRGLCTSALGTGVNKTGRKPEPRYGDAAPGAGACRKWVCINDAVPPDPEPQP